jgi:hypothetical protein
VAPEPARVLYEKAQDPTEDSPILYCERAYVVDGLQSDEELASHLLTELDDIRDGWQDRDSSQFVQLAAFDHEFEGEPRFPPLATLSWKDWHGRTELWVRGVRRSAIPPQAETLEQDAVELTDESRAAESLRQDKLLEARGAESDDDLLHDSFRPVSGARDSLAPDSIAPDSIAPDSIAPESLAAEVRRSRADVRSARESDAPPSERPPSDAPPSDGPVSQAALRESAAEAPASAEPSPEARAPRKGDSGTSWGSPARSGEYPIPVQDEPVPPPPSSQRLPAGEELIGLSFERMNELSYLPDLATGADFLLSTLEEFLPCSGIAIHLLDLERREFILFKALGPRAPELLGSRQPSDSLLGVSVQLGRAVRIEGIARKKLWSALGLAVTYGMCAPLQRGRVLGAVELGRTTAEGEFGDGQLKALQFICEQFAEFLAEHPFVPQR